MKELRSRTLHSREEADADLLDDKLEVSVDADEIVMELSGAEDDPPPDWLEPLEEDYVEDGKEGVASEEGTPSRAKRRGRWQKGKKRKVILSDEWVDCPELGKGWKRKAVFNRIKGSSEHRSTMHYMSPKGYRVRSKKELIKRVKIDLTQFNFNQGIFVEGFVKTRRGRPSATEEAMNSSFSSSRADTTDWDIIHASDKLSLIPQKLQLAPIMLASPPKNTIFGSPPELSLVSPVVLQAPQCSLSPSLRLDTFSQFTTAEKDKSSLLSHSWMPSPLAPVSPMEPPEKLPVTLQSAIKTSPCFRVPLDSSTALNGGTQENGFAHGCAECGCEYPGMGRGEELCPKCTLKKKLNPPHIIFKKKKKIHPLRKRHFTSRSRKLMAKREKERHKEIKDGSEDENDLPDGVDDDADGGDDADADGVDEDDDTEFGPKKRKRRMCGRCKACLRDQDCGKCDFCIDKPKFGGDNKKRQKCRFRQCQFQSRLQTWSSTHKDKDDNADDAWVRKQIRPPRKKKNKRRPFYYKFTDSENNEDEDEEQQRSGRKRRPGQGNKWRYSFKQEEDDLMFDREIEEEEADDTETQFVLCDDGNNVFYEEIYTNSQSLDAQNCTVDLVENSGGQPGPVESIKPFQNWVCTLSGLPEGSQVLGSIRLNSSGPLQASDVMVKKVLPEAYHMQNRNEQMSEAVNQSWLDLIQVETPIPQLVHPPQPAPQPLDSRPMITQIYSLEDVTQSDPSKDPGLMELLASLRQTVLPAHWVGVMAKGPLLQLFQCSKLSPMVDTVLQIETDFYYQINVQNQPLLLTHPIYERHPQRLTAVSQVVELLLDLEDMSVCQGYQSFEAGPHQGPLLCARAALCQLLIPLEDECCDRCMLPVEA
ncbi:methyl-CpG-binding domain protein 1a isoform X2 [Hoplias malabaricus]|uniref:methyl-CpG-binding domain protein 1a isoform X2 n=1 Tax=Hoplias malabaricus TaxID=27720 RepID=UPI003461F479